MARSGEWSYPFVDEAEVFEVDDDVDLFWVDDVERENLRRFEAAVFECLRVAGRVGLDIEWKPVTSGERPFCALLQVAFETEVFLVDLLVPNGLGNAGRASYWVRLSNALGRLLRAENVVKLGFGFVDDLARLFASHQYALPSLARVNSDTKACVNSLVELQVACRLMPESYAAECSPGRVRGLAAITLAVLGRRLDKTMQVSDWSCRPLSVPQLKYAMTDAWVLLRIADHLPLRRKYGLRVAPGGDVLPVGVGAVLCEGGYAEERDALETDEIGKCIALVVKESLPVLVVTRGCRRVNLNLVATHFRVIKRQVRMASPRECTEIFGHSPGHITPLGLRYREYIHVLFDTCLGELDPNQEIVCSGGAPGTVVTTTVPRLRGLCGAKWLTKPPSLPLWVSHVSLGRNGLIVDSTMKRAARLLRLLGLDTVCPRYSDLNDQLSLASNEGRVIITKNERVVLSAARLGLPCLPMGSQMSSEEVVLEVARVFEFDVKSENILSRCLKCNSASFARVDRSGVRGMVPSRSLNNCNEFWQCRGCRRIYWKGFHLSCQIQKARELCSALSAGPA